LQFYAKKENVTPNGIDYFGQKKPDKFPELEGCERKNSENSLFDVIDLMGSAEEEAKVEEKIETSRNYCFE
jgi:hypothetical protein